MASDSPPKRVSVYLNSSEYERIAALAGRASMTIPRYLRTLAQGHFPRDQHHEWVTNQLANLANSVEQLTNPAGESSPELQEILQQIRVMLKQHLDRELDPIEE